MRVRRPVRYVSNFSIQTVTAAGSRVIEWNRKPYVYIFEREFFQRHNNMDVIISFRIKHIIAILKYISGP